MKCFLTASVKTIEYTFTWFDLLSLVFSLPNGKKGIWIITLDILDYHRRTSS